jgi:histidyl-tRNA synthetase
LKYSRPRGTQDIVPPDIDKWRRVERAFQKTLDRFGYCGIRTPIFESTELFVRAVGEDTDIISKEMYTFEDKSGRSLTLRPENTASVIRAYLENGLHRWGGIQRLYYFGPMFRYDRPQTGRYRQFHQVGAEAIGSDNPALDVEMIQIVLHTLEALGFTNVDLKLNSVGRPKARGPYRKLLLEAIERIADRLALVELERYQKNPLRIFDSKDYGEDLKRELPVISSHLSDEDTEHFSKVKGLLTEANIVYDENPYLVRGLDYYTRTVFEVFYEKHDAQSALCGGGRYDELVEECGGPPTPAIGFSAGLERIIDALPPGSVVLKDLGENIMYYVVCADAASSARALRIASLLRQHGNAEVDLSGRSPKKQLQVAEKKKARFAVVVSSGDEADVVVKNISLRTEEVVGEDGLADLVQKRKAKGGTEE